MELVEAALKMLLRHFTEEEGGICTGVVAWVVAYGCITYRLAHDYEILCYFGQVSHFLLLVQL